MTSTLPGIDFFKDGVGGTTVASVKSNIIGRIRGQRSAVGPVLFWPLETPPGYTGMIIMLGGILKIPTQNEGITIPMQSYTSSSQLRIPITDEEFARIEVFRKGGAIAFELWLTGLGTINGETIALASNTQGVTILVPREDWLRVLKECGYGTRRLIELPPAPAREQQRWEDAAERIQAASNRLASGDAGGAMAQVRIGIERIVESVGEVIGRPRAPEDKALNNYMQVIKAELKKLHQARSDDSYQVLADTMQLAISSTEFASHPPHNDLDAAERVHAELAIATATAIYCYSTKTIR